MTMGTEQRRNVLVGVDGSPASRQALAFAEKEARMRGADLVVLTSVVGLDPMWLRPYGDIPSTADVTAKGEQRIREVIAEELGADPQVRVDVVATTVSAAAALVARSADAELLVVGSRGFGGFHGLVMGSVSMQCVLHARCPVTVVHAEEATLKPAAGAAAESEPVAVSTTAG